MYDTGYDQRRNAYTYHRNHPIPKVGCVGGRVEEKRPLSIDDVVPHTIK